MRFFTGLHQPGDAQHFDAAFISVNRLRKRKGGFKVGDWIMDSGGFTEISTYGCYRHNVAEYAAQIRRWAANGCLLAAAAQDWMCGDLVLKRAAIADGTLPGPEWFNAAAPNEWRRLGTVPWQRPGQRDEQLMEHQRRTIERYDALLAEDVGGIYVLPVLQGYTPDEYTRHIAMYGERLRSGMWVGVGSVATRNADPRAIEAVLVAIKSLRSDLLIHGFGLKETALSSPLVTSLLHTADSMAWSFAARRGGRNANCWREAKAWAARIESRPVQHVLDFI